MNWLVRWSLAGSLLVLLAGTAEALPPLPPYVLAHYKSQPEYAKFAETLGGLKMKCDACHQPGADKKAKGHGLNDYGEAVHKHLKHRDFLAANKEKSKPEQAALAKKLVDDALQAAANEKRADGKTFGELIKAGELPATN